MGNSGHNNLLKRIQTSMGKTVEFVEQYAHWIALGSVFLLYVSTFCPNLRPGDSAEFVTAAYSLGIAHPTGYPLYIILGKIVMTLFFFLPPPFVMNLLSVLFTSATLVFLIRILENLSINNITKAIAVLILGVAPDVWNVSLAAEVYPLSGLMTALIFYFVTLYHKKPDLLKLYAAAFTAGLSVGNHMTTVLLYPGLLIWVIWIFFRRLPEVKKKFFFLAGLFFFGGASILLSFFFLDRENTYNAINLYLLEHPQIDYLNDPFSRFLWMITGRMFNATNFFTAIFSDRLPANLLELATRIGNVNGLILYAGIAGLLPFSFRKKNPDTHNHLTPVINLMFIISLVLILLYFSTYLWAFETIFIIQGYIICSIGIALLLDRWFINRTVYACVITGLVVFCIFSVFHNFTDNNQMLPQPEWVNDRKEFMKTVEKNAVIFAGWDTATILNYFKYTEHIDPGILIIGTGEIEYKDIILQYLDRPCYFCFDPFGIPSSMLVKRKLFPELVEDMVARLEIMKYGIIEDYSRVNIPVPEGTPVMDSGIVKFNKTIKIICNEVFHSSQVRIGLDNNDSYTIIFLLDKTMTGSTVIPERDLPDGGISIRLEPIPGEIKDAGFDSVIIKPFRGDGHYYFSFIEFSPY